MMHKKVRKQFAEDKQTKDMDYWSHILWSDETKINLFGSDGVKRMWRQPGEEYKDNISHIAEKITNSVVNITAWLKHSCLQVNNIELFGQIAFSVRAATEWNLTLINIRNLNTYSIFKIQLKK